MIQFIFNLEKNLMNNPFLKTMMVACISLGVGVGVGVLSSNVFFTRQIKSCYRPKKSPEFLTRMYARELDLTPDQRARALAVFKKYQREIWLVKEKNRPELRKVFDRIAAELETILNDRQKEKYRAYRQKYRTYRDRVYQKKINGD